MAYLLFKKTNISVSHGCNVLREPQRLRAGGAGVFQPHINGLRAWAVMAVLLFHFKVPGFSGGFVGVDVFFAISGFLMTSIITRGLESNDFGLGGFYLARAKRILPPLMALCLLVLVLGWFWLLPPEEYRVLAKHVRDSMLFYSNATYLKESGYFDVASQEKWLLHTWSLSVEWQFYILFPVLCLFSWNCKPSRRCLLAVLSLVAGGSFFWAVSVASDVSSKGFYLVQSRAWEMLLGGLVFFIVDGREFSQGSRRWMEAIGLMIIVASVVGFSEHAIWPSWLTLIPLFGTVLVLSAGQVGFRCAGSFIPQWLGDRSYSIYLWHWPVVVALVYAGKHLSPAWVLAGIVGSLLLGHLSFVFIEGPARRVLNAFSAKTIIFILLMGVVVVSGTAAMIRNKLLTKPVPPEVTVAEYEGGNRNPRSADCFVENGEASPGCIFGGGKVAAVLVGDSHANAIVSAFAAAMPPGRGVLFWGRTSCPTLPGAKRITSVGFNKDSCEGFNDWVQRRLRVISSSIPLVIVNRSSYYVFGPNEDSEPFFNTPLVYFSRRFSVANSDFLDVYRKKYVESICVMAQRRSVYLMRPLPEMGVHVPKFIARHLMIGGGGDFSIPLEKYWQRHRFIWQIQDEARKRCGAKILNPLLSLCNDGRCYGSVNGRPLYFDDDHLSEFGNKRLVNMFKGVEVADL